MKILFLITEGSLGGAERCLLDLVASFRTHRPDIELGLIAGGYGPLVDAVRDLGVKVTVLELPASLASLGDNAVRSRTSAPIMARKLSSSALALASFVRELRAAILTFSPDVVHSNGMKMHLLGALARPQGVRVVWYLQDFVGERPLASRALRALSRRAALAVSNSEAVRKDFVCIAPRLPSRAVWNAIDTEEFTPEGTRAPLDQLAGATAVPNALRVGLVATYAKWKGQDIFLQAIEALCKTSPEIRAQFYIVGGPIYRTDGQFTENELRQMARSLGIADRVAFVPFQNKPADVFRALDVVVHASSRPEPFGRTIVEGMACGRAVIAVRDGGAAELISEGINALGIRPRDPASMATAIGRLCSDEALRSRMSQEARRDAVARFSRDRLAGDMLRAYLAMSD
jgi:glycosyltransferase involved in cell wall biosynthesis